MFLYKERNCWGWGQRDGTLVKAGIKYQVLLSGESETAKYLGAYYAQGTTMQFG